MKRTNSVASTVADEPDSKKINTPTLVATVLDVFTKLGVDADDEIESLFRHKFVYPLFSSPIDDLTGEHVLDLFVEHGFRCIEECCVHPSIYAKLSHEQWTVIVDEICDTDDDCDFVEATKAILLGFVSHSNVRKSEFVGLLDTLLMCSGGRSVQFDFREDHKKYNYAYSSYECEDGEQIIPDELVLEIQHKLPYYHPLKLPRKN